MISTRRWPLLAVAIAICMHSASVANAGTDTTGNAPAELNGPHVLKEKTVRLIGSGANVVRNGPGNSFAIVGIFEKGAEFVVIAKHDAWYNIRLSETNTGWVHKSLCKEFDDMSDLEFRPNPRLFSRVGTFAFTAYTGGYAFDRKSNSLVFGGRLGYALLDYVDVEGNVAWTHVTRPAEIVESLFGLALEEERFHMLFYALNVNFKPLPGRQMVPFVTVGLGSAIMQGQTEASLNYGLGNSFYVQKTLAVRFEFRAYTFGSGTSTARRDNTNFEFSVGTTFLF